MFSQPIEVAGYANPTGEAIRVLQMNRDNVVDVEAFEGKTKKQRAMVNIETLTGGRQLYFDTSKEAEDTRDEVLGATQTEVDLLQHVNSLLGEVIELAKTVTVLVGDDEPDVAPEEEKPLAEVEEPSEEEKIGDTE